MSERKPIIGLGGLAESGKTTIAKALHHKALMEGLQPITMSFAFPMKQMVDHLMRSAGVNEDDRARYMLHKKAPIPELQNHTMRHILQTLGTEWARHCLNPDFWANLAMHRAERAHANLVVFDDVRFANEADAIIAQGGKVFRLNRPTRSKPADSHASEKMDYLAIDWQNNKEPHEIAREIWLACDLPENVRL